jgi:hypothetical protein
MGSSNEYQRSLSRSILLARDEYYGVVSYIVSVVLPVSSFSPLILATDPGN